MTRQEILRSDSLLRVPELILLLSLVLCILGFLGIVIPDLSLSASVAGLFCGFWFSGYAVMTILLPYKASGERIVTIIGALTCSITFLTISALICEYTGKQAFSYLSTPQITPFFTSIILLYTTIFVLIALIMVYSRSERNTIPEFFNETGVKLRAQIPLILAGTLVILLFLGALAWGVSVTQPKQATELWLLSMNKTAADYPSSVQAGEGITSVIGIRSHEKIDTRFILITKVQNETVGSKQVDLAEGEMIEFPVTIEHLPGSPGDRVRIVYDLFTEKDSPITPYRRVSENIRIL